MALAYCQPVVLNTMIYCVISLILYKFVMSDRLESFSSKMMSNFLKKQFKFI